MKNTLFATTAIATAALTGAAFAAEAPTASVGGYFHIGTVITDADSGNGIGVLRDGEFHLKFKGTSDNGLTFDGRIEIEAFNADPDQIDENWARVSGSFGKIMIGSNDSAENSQVVGILYAPGARIGYYDHFSYVGGGLGTNTVGDQMGFHYHTPNLGGFSAAVSYHPNADSDGAGDTALDFNDDMGVEDVFSAGLSYSGDFGGFSVGASLGWATADGWADDVFNVGLTGGASGFTGGLFYERNNNDTADLAIGLQYKTGPWTVGGGYSTIIDGPDRFIAGGWVAYAVSPGVTGTVGLEYGGPDGDEELAGAAYLSISF